MKLITIKTDNAAFEDSLEISRIMSPDYLLHPPRWESEVE